MENDDHDADDRDIDHDADDRDIDHDADDRDIDHGDGVRNRMAGGHHNNNVQAHSIFGGLHIYSHQGEGYDASHPVIATVDIDHGLTRLVVDEDPPRAAPLSGALHILTLEAGTTRAVVLDAMRPVVISRRPSGRACIEVRVGGYLEARPFTCDLDTGQPRLQAGDRDFPFTISPTDVERFHIVPQVRTHETHWRLELDWILAGRRGTTVIDDNGKPFVLHPDVTLRSDGGDPDLDWGCSLFHKPGCPAQRLALRSTQGTICTFHDTRRGTIYSDAGGDLVVFDHTAIDSIGLPQLTPGQRVEFEAVMTHGGPRAIAVRPVT
ncbi:cold-shock protein [Actinophytocola sediminis]